MYFINSINMLDIECNLKIKFADII